MQEYCDTVGKETYKRETWIKKNRILKNIDKGELLPSKYEN